MNKKKIKIVHVTRYAYPYIGGIESVIEQINESLPNEQFEKEVLCCSNSDKTSIENGVKYNRCKFLFEIFNNTISPSFIWQLSRVKADVVHYHMPFIFAVVAHFIARPRCKKMFITYHSDLKAYEKIMKYLWWLYEYFYKISTKIHVLSPQAITNDWILDKIKNKCEVIPFGLNLNQTNQEHNGIINGINIKEITKNRKVLLCIGRFVNLKGFIYAIKAMEQVDNSAILLIAGDGLLKNDFELYIKEHNLEDKVKLIGFISNQIDKDYLYSIIDILLMTSIKTESFAIVQLEAMKHSKPVINTNLGTGVNFVSINNETGLTVEPCNVEELAKAINVLLTDEELRNKLGQNARKRVEELFDIEKIKDKYIKMYED